MIISFDIPDKTRAFHGCLVYEKEEGFDLQMVTWDMPTNGLEDKMLVVLPPERLDGECEKNCLTCRNSFSDEEDHLHCMADGHNHEEIVADGHTCKHWS